MRRAIYANLQLWDPMGQMKIEPGLVYGGQSMLFALAADDLVGGLLRLIDAVAEKGLGLMRVLYAGYCEDFEPDHFPFGVDLEPMVRDALDLDKVCAIGPFTFEPAAAPEAEEVMLACVDIAEDSGGGALCLAAVQGGVADGLRRLLQDFRDKEIKLFRLEDAKDASEHAEVYSFETSLEDMVKRARATPAPVYSDKIGYEAAG